MCEISIRRLLVLSVLGCGLVVTSNNAKASTTADPSTMDTASTPGTAGADSMPEKPATTMDAEVPPPANLMTLLDKIGIGKPLDKLGININGHVEGSYTYQFLQPAGALGARHYDFVSNRGLLNQAAINIERPIDVRSSDGRETNVASDHFDIGFRVEALEGTDAAFTQTFQSFGSSAKGNSNYVFDVGGNDSSYQFDLPDLYVDFGIPLGRGIRVRAGRFEFFKPIDPNDRIFYSTTFVYANALPTTNTGVTVAYDFCDRFGIEAGFSRGANMSVSDYNGSIDFIGKTHLNLSDKATLTATGYVGPELAHDSRDYSLLIDLAATYQVTDQLSFLFDGFYAHQFGDSTISQGFGLTSDSPAALVIPDSYYGASANVVYQVCPYFSLAARGEWFRDESGLLLGGISTSLYEATVGSTITPFPNNPLGQNFKFRPEVRCDYASKAIFGDGRHDQLTFAADVIYNF